MTGNERRFLAFSILLLLTFQRNSLLGISAVGSESTSLQYEKVEKAFQEFAQTLVPPESLVVTGLAKVREITKILRKSRKDIHRIVLVGSWGKDTAIYYPGILQVPDFDISVFLNNNPGFSSRPFSWVETIKEFRSVLISEKPENASKFSGPLKIAKMSPFYVTVKLGEVKIDISPVMNLWQSPLQNFMENLPPLYNTQQVKTIEKIAALPNPIQQLRSHMRGFTEAHVTILQKFSGQSRALIRLAKFWSKTSLKLDPKVFNPVGFSSLFERLAIHAAILKPQCEGKVSTSQSSNSKLRFCSKKVENLSLVGGLSRFFELLMNFPSLNIQNDDEFTSHPSSSLFNHSCHVAVPFVADLADPFTNYALLERDAGKRRSMMQIIMETARRSLLRLGEIIDMDDGGNQSISTDKILAFFTGKNNTKNFS